MVIAQEHRLVAGISDARIVATYSNVEALPLAFFQRFENDAFRRVIPGQERTARGWSSVAIQENAGWFRKASLLHHLSQRLTDGRGSARNDPAAGQQLGSVRRIQLTTDGLRLYIDVVDALMRDRVDYATLHKLYGATTDERTYSPAQCSGTEKRVIMGRPDPLLISTSYVERQTSR